MAGRVAPEDIAELRERSDLAEIVSAHTQLKKTGRIYKGLCCFHQEKTPSLTVDPEKQLYYCHGCGVGGDVFSFLQKADGLSFSESAERLADRLGIKLRSAAPAGPAEGARSPLLAANEAAASLFAELLWQAPEARGARKYLEGRGFSPQDAEKWRLGFSPPGSDVLYRRLLDRKFTPRQIIEAGLALVTEGGEHRDRFRGRLMFPVTDLSGKVVGFGARALGAEQPKYLNTSETAVYRKSRILFGLDRAKSAMVHNGAAIVTEGYTDVIALSKAGFSEVVATCGTALGEDHFALIKRFCERVILAFDADAAGQVASERGFGIHRKMGLEVLVAPIPEGKDPADVALESGGDGFRAILDRSKPLMEFVLEREISRHRRDTPQGKAKAVEAAVEKLRWEPSPVARSEYGLWVAGLLGVDPQQVQLTIAKSAGEPGRSYTPEVVRMPGHLKVERQALAILLESPSQRAEAARFTTDHFTQPAHRTLFSALVDMEAATGRSLARAGAASAAVSPASVLDHLPDDETRRLAAELALSPSISADTEEVFRRLEEFEIERRIASAQAKLKRLNSETDSEEYDLLFTELMRLESERRRFEKD